MKLSLKEKVLYGLGDTACNFVFATVQSFLLFYYTDVFGLPAVATAQLFLGVRVTDAFVDLFIGAVSDRTKTRWGSFRPWLLWFSGPLALIMILTFTVPIGPPSMRLIYAWVTYLLLMFVFSAVNLPYSALSGVMTDDPHERTSLAGIRMVGAQIGSLIVAAGTLPLIALFSGTAGNLARGYQHTMMLFGAAAFAMLLLTFFGTRERIQPQADQAGTLLDDFSMLRRNIPWVVLTFAAVIISITWAIRQAAVIYYFKYYIGNESGASLFLTVSCIGSILGALLSGTISRRLGKRAAFQLGAVATGFFWAVVYWVPRDSSILLEVVNACGSLAMFTVMPLLFSMLGDTADYGEWKTRRRATGMIFCASTFATKVGMGLGGAFAAALLGFVGYVPSAQAGATAVHAIVLMMTLIPGLGFLLLWLVMGLYSLDERQSAAMRSELTQRRSNASAGI